MMKNFWTTIVMLLWGLGPTFLYASDFWMYQDLEKFPKQSSFLDTTVQDFLKPGQRTSFGVGLSHVGYYFDLEHYVDGMACELKLDVPLGRLNKSIGMDCVYFTKPGPMGVFEILAGEILVLPNTTWKWPVSTALGDISGMIIPKVGLILIPEAYSATTGYHNNIGAVLGIGLGVDWYPWEWLGFFLEGSAKYNRILSLYPSSRAEEYGNEYQRQIQRERYSSYTLSVTAGVKTSF